MDPVTIGILASTGLGLLGGGGKGGGGDIKVSTSASQSNVQQSGIVYNPNITAFSPGSKTTPKVSNIISPKSSDVFQRSSYVLPSLSLPFSGAGSVAGSSSNTFIMGIAALAAIFLIFKRS